MPKSAAFEFLPRRGFANSQVLFLATGLVAGVLLGAIVLRGSSSDNRAAASGSRSTAVAPSIESERKAAVSPEPPTTPDPRQAAHLAELETELEAAAMPTDDDADAAARPPASASGEPPVIHPQPTALPAEPRRQARASGSARSRPAAPGARGPATLDYWNALNDVISREAAMRVAPGQLTAENAGGFVDARSQAAGFASSSIRAIDTTGVDSEAVALGQELVSWYVEEEALSRRAKSLLGSSDIKARKGSAGNAWKQAEEEHRRRCDTLNRHGADMRARLSKRYGLKFPPLN